MNIACIGNIVFDMSVWGEGFIIEDIRTNFKGKEITPGGPANNAAYVLAKFGNSVDLYGKVGNDLEGNYILNQMIIDGIYIEHISSLDNYTTPFSFIINNTLNGSRSICTIRDESDFENSKIENIKYEKKYNYILTDGKYLKETLYLVKNNPDALTIMDAGRFNSNTEELSKIVDIVISSQIFAENKTGIKNPKTTDDFVNLYKQTQKDLKNPHNLVITIGEKGYICEKNGEVVIMPAFNTGEKVIETTGAGDIFHGAFTHAIANDYSFHESLEFANITASLSTTKKGARYSCPDLETVLKIFNKNNEPPKKLVLK